MAKFHIGTPGGYDVEVRADTESEALEIARSQWQTLPRVIATTEGNGRVLERDGRRFFVSPEFSTSDPERVSQIMQGLSPGQLSRKSFDEQTIAAAPAAARAAKFVEGVPFVGTFADEALGAIAGPEATAAMRASLGAMSRQRPGESLALNLAGGLLTGGAAAAAAPAGALPAIGASMRTLPGVAAGGAIGAGLGATEGAVAGFGAGTDAQSRIAGAQTGAAFGGAAGGALGAAAPLAAKAARNVMGMFRRSDIDSIAKDLGISRDAARVIKLTFDQGGDMQAARANLARAGSEGMLADAGAAAQSLLDAAAATGGPAAQVARGAVDARASRTAAALDRTLDEALGVAPAGPQTAISSIAQRTAPQRQEAFDRAFASVVDYTSEEGAAVVDALSRIPPKVLNAAIDEANEQLIASGRRISRIKATFNKAGEVVTSAPLSVRQLHEVKIALGSMAEDAKGDLGRVTAKSLRLSRQARDLRRAIGDAVPDYDQAIRLGGDKIAEQNAFELGASLLRPQTNVEDVLLELGDTPSITQLEAAKSGLRGAIDKALGDVRAVASDPNMDARQLRQALTMLSSDNARAKARALLGKEADTLFAQITEAEQSLLVRSAMARGSQTASRQAVQGAVEDVTSPGLIGTAMRGEPLDATKRLIQGVTGQTDEFTASQRQTLFADISRALTEKVGDDARASLELIDRAVRGQILTEAETQRIAEQLVNIGFAGVTPQAEALPGLLASQ